MKENYKGKKKGWFAWIHHDTVLEWSDDIMERVEYVRENKPTDELKTRREHMIVAPDSIIPKYVKEAYRKWEKAYYKREEAYRKQEEAYRKWEEADRKYLLALKKINKNPTLIKYLKEHTPYSWNEEWRTLIYTPPTNDDR